MKDFFSHLFLPHESNNQRAKLLHAEVLLFLVIGLISLALLIGPLKASRPQVLGISVDISSQDLLILTNQKRHDAGLGPLAIDGQLSQAAQAKASDMFAKNYWSHFSPTGKSPWDFIHEAGYQYTYAGENLARGFTTAQDTIAAWMASPDHRANMLSKNFTDVGFAVEKGNLTGDSGTVLVVEMFGAKAQLPEVVGKAAAAQIPTISPYAQITQSVQQHPIINSALAKTIGIFLLSLFVGLFILDLILIRQKRVARIVGHNLDHILYLGAMLIIAGMIGSGMIF